MLKCYHHPAVLNFRFRMCSLSPCNEGTTSAHIFCFTPLHLMTDAKDASTTMKLVFTLQTVSFFHAPPLSSCLWPRNRSQHAILQDALIPKCISERRGSFPAKPGAERHFAEVLWCLFDKTAVTFGWKGEPRAKAGVYSIRNKLDG